MSHRSRTSCLVVLAVMAIAAGGCGGAVATGDLDKMQAAISPFYITITNSSGRAILEVRPAIVQVGGQSEYSTYLPRLENDEKRDIAVNTFRNSDGVPFSPRTAKAASVVVTAKDIDGKDLRIEVPWE